MIWWLPIFSIWFSSFGSSTSNSILNSLRPTCQRCSATVKRLSGSAHHCSTSWCTGKCQKRCPPGTNHEYYTDKPLDKAHFRPPYFYSKNRQCKLHIWNKHIFQLLSTGLLERENCTWLKSTVTTMKIVLTVIWHTVVTDSNLTILNSYQQNEANDGNRCSFWIQQASPLKE